MGGKEAGVYLCIIMSVRAIQHASIIKPSIVRRAWYPFFEDSLT